MKYFTKSMLQSVNDKCIAEGRNQCILEEVIANLPDDDLYTVPSFYEHRGDEVRVRVILGITPDGPVVRGMYGDLGILPAGVDVKAAFLDMSREDYEALPDTLEESQP